MVTAVAGSLTRNAAQGRLRRPRPAAQWPRRHGAFAREPMSRSSAARTAGPGRMTEADGSKIRASTASVHRHAARSTCAVRHRLPGQMLPRRQSPNVFVHVPCDDAYEALFEALVFTVSACGYRVRCALEDDVSGDIRPDKLVQVIRESPRSIHALPRVEPDRNELSRFNMRSNWNWDLAERGSASVSATASRTWCTPLQVARILIGSRRQRSRTGYSHRQQLSAAPSGGIPRQIHYQADEISGFGNDRTFVWCVAEILRRPNAPTRTDGRRPSLPWRGRVPETSVPPAVTRLGAEP
jgi:hypothetical protein